MQPTLAYLAWARAVRITLTHASHVYLRPAIIKETNRRLVNHFLTNSIAEEMTDGLLNQYDTGNFPKGGLNEQVIDVIKPQEAIEAIDRLRETLIKQKEASVLFGSSKDERLLEF